MNNNPTNDAYSIITHKNVQQEQTIHNSLYRLANFELQLNYDPEDLYRTNDWNRTNSHKGKLVIAYNNKVGNETLHPRVFYALYIRPNDTGNGHLIYRLSKDQISITKEYQSVPVSDGLIEAINKINSYGNKIQAIHLEDNHSIVQDDHSSNHNEEGHIHINDVNISEDKSHDELDCPPQLNSMESNKIVNQGYKIILPVGPTKSTSMSVKHNGTTNTNTFLQDSM